MEVLQFVELGAVNPLSFDHPYYLSPRKGGEKAYGVLRDALLEARRVGIARFVLRKRPTLAALLPGPTALALESLRSYEELRDPARLGVPAHAKKSAEVKMARHADRPDVGEKAGSPPSTRMSTARPCASCSLPRNGSPWANVRKRASGRRRTSSI